MNHPDTVSPIGVTGLLLTATTVVLLAASAPVAMGGEYRDQALHYLARGEPSIAKALIRRSLQLNPHDMSNWALYDEPVRREAARSLGELHSSGPVPSTTGGAPASDAGEAEPEEGPAASRFRGPRITSTRPQERRDTTIRGAPVERRPAPREAQAGDTVLPGEKIYIRDNVPLLKRGGVELKDVIQGPSYRLDSLRAEMGAKGAVTVRGRLHNTGGEPFRPTVYISIYDTAGTLGGRNIARLQFPNQPLRTRDSETFEVTFPAVLTASQSGLGALSARVVGPRGAP